MSTREMVVLYLVGFLVVVAIVGVLLLFQPAGGWR